ncbi:serine hydrolase [Streptomyces sp. NRRL F-5650]|uniref:serine hydrolase n=1 Tax=Streptomyces sp. NRRL F-5650 TaxID=1463868 RepID=UPI0004CAD670|nr:serine hydrolase [Streptomyces sp. NRRL F-5650]
MPNVKGARLRRSRAGAGVVLASVTALFSLGGLHAVPSVAADAGAQGPSRTRVTAAVLPLDDGTRKPLLSGKDTAYDTASIVKVDVLAALLLQAQDEGRHLTAQERALAEPMIRNSDNAATNTLWREIGGAPALEAANKRMGLTATRGGPGAKWGLTRTTASDQIRLLLAVFDGTPAVRTASPLDKDSRTYIQNLMTRVADDQAWGVSAVSGSGYALKNGWLQRTATGLWDVNSVGRVTVDGHRYLVAVLSDGSGSMSDGVSVVERTARQAVAATTRT